MYEVGAVGSKPDQSGFGFPPVQAEYSSLEVCTTSPMMGFGGFRGAYTMLTGAGGGPVPLPADAKGSLGSVIVAWCLSLINEVNLGEP